MKQILLKLMLALYLLLILLIGTVRVLGSAFSGGVLAFSSAGSPYTSIYLLDIDRGIRVLIAERATNPVWSSTGNLAYVSYDAHIYLWSPATGETRFVSDHLGRNRQPAWSYDGRYLTYTSEDAMSHFNDIYLFDSLTGVLRNLGMPMRDDMLPAWSADGRLAYVMLDEGGDYEIYVEDVGNVSNNAVWDGEPLWSPS